MGPELHTNPLWAFSLEHYARPGVKPACLTLQDTHGLDVNVALACAWHERRGGASLSPADIKSLLARVTTEQARVWSIRPLRREAKTAPHANALYKALKQAELLAENLLQRALFEGLSVERTTSAGSSGEGSLQAYASLEGTTISAPLLRAFLGE